MLGGKFMEWVISVIWDDMAKVWVATNDQLGLTLESASFDLLVKRVESAVPELIELNGLSDSLSILIKAEKHQMVKI